MDAIVGEAANHAECGEIIGAAHSVERDCGNLVGRFDRSARNLAACIVEIGGSGRACFAVSSTRAGSAARPSRRHDPFGDRVPGGNAFVGATAFEHHGFVIWQSCVQQRRARSSKSQCKCVLRMRQLGARHERMPDNRNIPASLGDQILHRSAFALLVGKIHGIHGWRFLACVEQYERAPAVEFGER